MDYRPEPIDTSGVELEAAIRELLELLARNTHEVWARQRLTDGWRYGPQRDDAHRRHPGLVPYDDLPEDEKEYDRNTARAALETIVALGYRIESGAAAPAEDADQRVGILLDQADDPKADTGTLVALWQGRDPAVWSRSRTVYERIADRLLRMGSPTAAHEVLEEALECWPRHVRLRQLQGLALARLRITERAQQVLTGLYEQGEVDEETMGILARTHKDQALAAAGEERRRSLRRAHGLYAESFHRYGGYWAAINAATTAVLLDDAETAHSLARRVLELGRSASETET